MAEKIRDDEAFTHLEPREDQESFNGDIVRSHARSYSQDAPLLTLNGPNGRFRRRVRAYMGWLFGRGRRHTLCVLMLLFFGFLAVGGFFTIDEQRASQFKDYVKDRLPTVSWQKLEGAMGGRITYTNQRAFLNTNLEGGCLHIPQEVRDNLDKATTPLVQVVANNALVTKDTVLQAPVLVCILVGVPQHEFANGSYPDAPVPGKGPDTIHMYLNSSDIINTFPPMRPMPGQDKIDQQFYPGVIIYSSETPVYNYGHYVVQADIEHTNWLWAQEWHNVGFDFTPKTGLKDTKDMYSDHLYKSRPITPFLNFTVEGPKHLPALPVCDNETSAAQGRWYKYSKFPVLERELVDEWGYTWQGDKCHLDTYTAIDSLDCLANKTIHVWGDSMSRRLAKSLMSGGKWCMDPLAKCQDEDDVWGGTFPKLDVDPETGGIYVGEIMRDSHFERYDTSNVTFGKNTTIFFEFITAIAGSSGTWMQPLYDEKDRYLMPQAGNGLPVDAMGLNAGAVARAPPEMAPADLVIIGFGAWDQAFTDTFDQYEEALVMLRDAFLEAYPTTPMVVRLGNQWCCRNTNEMFRRYTGGRIQEFGDRSRKVWRVDPRTGTGLDGRVHILDPQYMNGRPDVIHDFKPSNANHPRASHVRIEMQMVMNSVCKRNAQGVPEFNPYFSGMP